MQGTLAGTFARVVGGVGIVASAAVIALAAGGGSLFGGLGGLFGRSGPSLQVAGAAQPASDLVAALPSPVARLGAVRHATVASARRSAPPATQRLRPRTGRPTAPARTGAPLQPAPPAAPAPVAPAPRGGEVVTTAAGAVDQIVARAPAPLQPLAQPLDDAVSTVVRACTGLPICP